MNIWSHTIRTFINTKRKKRNNEYTSMHVSCRLNLICCSEQHLIYCKIGSPFSLAYFFTQLFVFNKNDMQIYLNMRHFRSFFALVCCERKFSGFNSFFYV